MARTRSAAVPSGLIIETICGGDTFKDGTKAGKVFLESPQGVAVDAQGNVYFADKPKGRVYQRKADGLLYAYAGTGVSEFSGDGGPARSARFHQLYGLALGRQGELFIADCGNRRIRCVDASGRVETLFGTGAPEPLPLKEFGLQGKPALQAPLADPYGVLYDPSGCLWVSDCAGQRVYRYDLATSRCLPVVVYEKGGPAYPTGLALVGERLFIADRIGRRIMTYDLKTGKVESWLGGVRDRPWVDFDRPDGLAFDGKKYLYVSDQGLHRIFRIDMDKKEMEVFAGGGQGFRKGEDRRKIQLHSPGLMAFAGDGSLVFSDQNPEHHAILAIAPDGRAATVAGAWLGQIDVPGLGDQGPAADALLFNPRGVAIGPNGDVFVSDCNHRRIRRIERASGRIATAVGKGWVTLKRTWPDLEEKARVGGDPKDCHLFSPRGLAFDGSGSLYIVDANFRTVLKADPQFKRINWFVKDRRMLLPRSIAMGSGGELYVDDGKGHVIWRITPQGESSVFAGQLGQQGFEGDEGPATQAKFNAPSGVAIGPEGEIYVGDRENHRVRCIRQGVVTTVAGTGRKGKGCPDGPALGADLFRPQVLAADAGGDLFFTDYIRRIMKLEIGSGKIKQFAGGLQYGFAGDGGPASGSAQLADPRAMAIRDGEYLIADNANHALRSVRKAP